MSLTTGGHHPSHSQKVRFQGNSAPAAPAGLGIGGFGTIATGLASLKPWDSVEKFFLSTAKEGPIAIAPLESAVLVGRSERAYKRDGLLELQERLTEEMAAAVVWLFGVGFLQNQFETVSNKLSRGKHKHLSTNIAWNMPWKKVQNIDLTPQEMFSRNNKEINTLLKLKSARWLFSVGTALALVGYFIPKGNQLKTNMILRHLERRKRASEGSNVQFGDPNQQNQPNGSQQRVPGQAPVHPMAPQPPANPSSHSLMPHMPVTLGGLLPSTHLPVIGNTSTPQGSSNRDTTGTQSNPIATPYNHSLSTQFLGQGQSNNSLPTGMNANHGNSGVRFGSGFPLLSFVEAGGAAVEQTNYGQLLAVDFGIAGGRGYVASKRSPYETAEVLFRDIVSLYFYILCAPHLMKLLTTGMDKGFGSSSHLQPKVAKLLHDHIERGLEKGLTMDRIIYGLSTGQMDPEGPLKTAMRSIDKDDLKKLMNKEIRVYLGGKPISAEIDKAIESYITPSQVAAGTRKIGALNPSYIHRLLEAISDGQGAFGKLSGPERQNLSIAVKQAARHTVGMRVNLDDVTKTVGKEAKPSKFNELIETLEKEENSSEIQAEGAFLRRRIGRIAELEGMNQSHSMLRRSANILREKLSEGEDAKLVQLGDAHANWLDKAMHHAETIKDHFTQNLEEVGSQLHGLKLEGESLKNISKALGGKTLGELDSYKEAVSKASTSQLQRLALEVKDLYQLAGKPSKLWPLKTQSGRLKALHESLEDVNLRLSGGSHAEPVEAMRESIMHFMARIKDHGKATAAERDLLGHYEQEIQKIVKGREGRMFSLAIKHEDEALGNKLREILRGGLISDSRLVKKALITVGQLETDTRKMPSPTNESNMRKAIANYTEALYKRYNPANTGVLDKAKREALEIELKTYQGLNRNLHYIARGLSLGTAMACIGWLVPIMQTRITKHLTGKDKNPGIASAKKLMDDADAKAGEKKEVTSSGQATPQTVNVPAKPAMPAISRSAFQSSALPFQTPHNLQAFLPIIS